MRFRRKPEPDDREDQLAAQWVPGRGTVDLRKVADEVYLGNAQFAVATFGDEQTLIVRYMEPSDCGPPRLEHIFVRPGQWLAYSPGNGFLYACDDANWAQFYDRVG